MRENVSVQMNDHAFKGQNSISLLNVLSEFKQVCNYSPINEGATVWFFR